MLQHYEQGVRDLSTEAMLLKTPSGQRKRMEAYLAKLEAHKTDFLDVEDTYDPFAPRFFGL